MVFMPENLTALASGSFVLCLGLSLGGKYVFSGICWLSFLGFGFFQLATEFARYRI
jgi:hypothetical protein